MNTTQIRPCCHVCKKSTQGPVPNTRSGGFFWLCKKCDITWDLDGKRCYGDPSVVASASKLRGRCISLKQTIIAQLCAKGMPAADASEYVQTRGIKEAEFLLQDDNNFVKTLIPPTLSEELSPMFAPTAPPNVSVETAIDVFSSMERERLECPEDAEVIDRILELFRGSYHVEADAAE